MAPPVLTPEQRAGALVKAAAARKARADIRASLKNGGMTVAELIKDAEASDLTGGMKVSAVIQSLPGMGKAKTAGLMGRLGIPENRRVRGLSARQRSELEKALAPLDA